MRLQAIANTLQKFSQIQFGTPEEKAAFAKRAPGTVSTSNARLQSELYPRLVLPSNMSSDVSTPRTEPQNIFERNMDAPHQIEQDEWAGHACQTTKLRPGVWLTAGGCPTVS